MTGLEIKTLTNLELITFLSLNFHKLQMTFLVTGTNLHKPLIWATKFCAPKSESL